MTRARFTCTIVEPLTRYFAGISTLFTYTAWSGDKYRSHDGTFAPNAPRATRTGQTFSGSGYRAQSTERCPIQTIGSTSPSLVRTRSPTRSSSTATRPSGVSIRVPAAKHAIFVAARPAAVVVLNVSVPSVLPVWFAPLNSVTVLPLTLSLPTVRAEYLIWSPNP